jgi:hypothetical protein
MIYLRILTQKSKRVMYIYVVFQLSYMLCSAYDSRDKKNELKEMIETICKSKAEYDIGLRAYFNLEGILNFRITNTKFIKE